MELSSLVPTHPKVNLEHSGRAPTFSNADHVLCARELERLGSAVLNSPDLHVAYKHANGGHALEYSGTGGANASLFDKAAFGVIAGVKISLGDMDEQHLEQRFKKVAEAVAATNSASLDCVAEKGVLDGRAWAESLSADPELHNSVSLYEKRGQTRRDKSEYHVVVHSSTPELSAEFGKLLSKLENKCSIAELTRSPYYKKVRSLAWRNNMRVLYAVCDHLGVAQNFMPNQIVQDIHAVRSNPHDVHEPLPLLVKQDYANGYNQFALMMDNNSQRRAVWVHEVTASLETPEIAHGANIRVGDFRDGLELSCLGTPNKAASTVPIFAQKTSLEVQPWTEKEKNMLQACVIPASAVRSLKYRFAQKENTGNNNLGGEAMQTLQLVSMYIPQQNEK